MVSEKELGRVTVQRTLKDVGVLELKDLRARLQSEVSEYKEEIQFLVEARKTREEAIVGINILLRKKNDTTNQ